MNTNTTNEGVMNNNTQPQNELFQILKEIERLRFERGKINSELTTKIKDLENKKNEVQINLFPIKMGDEVITKQMYKIFKINKKVKPIEVSVMKWLIKIFSKERCFTSSLILMIVVKLVFILI
jgi:hypothetical protein